MRSQKVFASAEWKIKVARCGILFLIEYYFDWCGPRSNSRMSADHIFEPFWRRARGSYAPWLTRVVQVYVTYHVRTCALRVAHYSAFAESCAPAGTVLHCAAQLESLGPGASALSSGPEPQPSTISALRHAVLRENGNLATSHTYCASHCVTKPSFPPLRAPCAAQSRRAKKYGAARPRAVTARASVMTYVVMCHGIADAASPIR